eukprot:CAMPEP_0117444692 /NCGR_PEP_ID=MMETSP0759-20121206/5378_1 /TAXON_ID=63605 /ORGANISM="Percolomonas cosmopolitus, Strain WS" /LENGTH=681 /DNA_ID=CAMNT_0005236779 /DNA_START=400 /DNA_END=2445 /DNA_ORIENTATION=-
MTTTTTTTTYTQTPGNNLRFNWSSPQDLTSFTDKLVQQSKAFYDEIANEKNATFNSVVKRMALFEGKIDTDTSSVSFPKDIHPDKAIRDASTECTNTLNSFFIDIFTRKDLYDQFRKVRDSDEYSQLNPLDKRLLDRYIRDFERNGLALPEEKQQRVKEIKKKLAELSVAFQKNIGEDKTQHLFTDDELDGCPLSYIKGLKKDEDTGKRVVTLQYPDLIPLVQYAKNPQTRKTMDFLKAKQCQEVNVPIFEEVLGLRRELAKLMGFQHFADYSLNVTMAKDADTANKFVNDLRERLTEPGKEELKELMKYKKKDGFTDDIQSYDWNYYFRVRKEAEYSLDNDKIKQYFPTKKVISGAFEIFERLLGVKFVQEPDNKCVWEHLKLYSIYDKKDPDTIIGQLYLDLHPRDGKYGHAAMFPLQPACLREDGNRQHAVAAMVCNFPKDSKDEETGKVIPSTMPFDDMITYLHELGHCLHGVLSRATYAKFSGTSVTRDFVEMPSQLLENWGWCPESLALLSAHVETGEPLPKDIVDKMIAARNCNVALFNLRQLFFGILDLQLHCSTEYVDTGKLWNEMRPKIQLVNNPDGTNGFGGFAHLLGGYEAGYFSYLWSLSLAADMFSRFKKEGIFSESTGRDYRRIILERGDEIDNMDLMREFLGREPGNEAFLEHMGFGDLGEMESI